MVVVGASMGGLAALQCILRDLSAGFPWPVAIVQHRSVDDIVDSLSLVLQQSSALPVREVDDKDPIVDGVVYIGPSDYHLLVGPEGFSLSTDAKVNFARPCVDVLIESAVALCASSLVAVILTGASVDGAAGAARVKAEGGTLVVQDPATAESPLMPRAAISAAVPDQILPLAEIGPYLNRLAVRHV
jgi:two-component system chemotaxis response regulator CheB